MKKNEVKKVLVKFENGRFSVIEKSTGEKLKGIDGSHEIRESLKKANEIKDYCNSNGFLIVGFTGTQFKGVFIPEPFKELGKLFKGMERPEKALIRACNAVSLAAYITEVNRRFVDAANRIYRQFEKSLKQKAKRNKKPKEILEAV